MENKFEAITYKDNETSFEINIDTLNETAWFTQNNLVQIFQKDKSTISRLIKRIRNENQDKKWSVVAKNAITCADGKTYMVTTYNLDLVMEISNKLSSKKGQQIKDVIDEYFSKNTQICEETIIYNNGTVNLTVNVSPQENTVWLTQRQIALLFDVGVANINLHTLNILKEKELDHSVFKESLITAEDGKTYRMKLFNLDMIIAIGYRIKSPRGIEFRKWANNILKRYLVYGYAIDSNRVKSYDENIIRLENDIKEIHHELNDIKQKMFIEPVKERLFCKGQYYDAYDYISHLIRNAKQYVLLIDPYFDNHCLVYLKNISKEINKTVCYGKESQIIDEEIEIYEKQYGKVNLIKNTSIHDRFLIIDEKQCYSIGTSFNSQGSKVSVLLEIESKEIISSIIKISNVSK